MNGPALVELVTKLYVAAGREAAEVEFAVYADALTAVPDDLGLAAGAEIIQDYDLADPRRRPSPSLVLTVCGQIARRQRDERSRSRALVESTGPPVQREEAIRWIGRIRTEHTLGHAAPKGRGVRHVSSWLPDSCPSPPVPSGDAQSTGGDEAAQ